MCSPRTLSDLFSFLQPGVVLAIIPEAQYTSWATYWIRDASLVYHIWLNKLIVYGGNTAHVRALVDDAVHALIRSQHVSNLAGNVLTGGLAEAVYDPRISKLLDPLSRSGSPVAGALLFVSTRIELIQPHRYGAPSCFCASEVC